MAQPSKEFGRLLTQALRYIHFKEANKISIIQDEIGQALGLSGGDMIERWRGSRNLPDPTKPKSQKRIEDLTRILVERTDIQEEAFNRQWFRRFLRTWGHPSTPRKRLLDELFPEVGEIEGNTSNAPTQDDPSVDEGKKNSRSQLELVRPIIVPPINKNPFVGRVQDLSKLERQLKEQNVAFITGMAGMGKTALGMALARKMVHADEQIFWYTLQGQDDLARMVHRLADFLAYHGNPSFYELLQNGTTKPYTILLEQILPTLESQQFLLCFDDFHRLEEASLEPVMTTFLDGAKRGKIHLLIMSRQVPQGTQNMTQLTLEGLKESEFRQLVTQLDVSSSEESLNILYNLTQGSPLFTLWGASIMRDPQGLVDLISRIVQEVDLKNFMLDEIDKKLKDDEQVAIQAMAICLNKPAPRALLEEIADGKNLLRPLRQLCSQHLVQLDEQNKTYSQHALVQQFYYELLNKQERLVMHGRAARYYCGIDDYFKAATHYQLAEQYEEAALQLIGERRHTIVNQGYAVAAGKLLKSIQEHLELEADYESQLYQTLGTFYRIQGAFENAMTTFETGCQQANEPQREIEFLYEILRVYRSQGTFGKALEIAQKIMNRYEQNPELVVDAQVLNGIGSVHLRLSQIEDAKSYFVRAWGKDGGKLEPDTAAHTLLGLGAVALRVEDFQQAEAHFIESRQRFKRLKNLTGEAQSLNNLGVIYQEQQKNEEALDCLEDMLEIVESIGDIHEAMIGHHNIALTYIQHGKFSIAETYLRDGINLAERIKNHQLLCRLQANLARVYLRIENIDEAKQHLADAELCRQEAGNEAEQGILYYISGEIALAEARYSEGLELAEQAIPLLERTHEEDYLPSAKLVREQALECLSGTPSDD